MEEKKLEGGRLNINVVWVDSPLGVRVSGF